MESKPTPRIGAAVRHLLIDLGLSSSEAAARLGVTRSRFSRLLDGQLDWTDDLVHRLWVGTLGKKPLTVGAGEAPQDPLAPVSPIAIGPKLDWLTLVFGIKRADEVDALEMIEVGRTTKANRRDYRSGIGPGFRFGRACAAFVGRRSLARRDATVVIELMADALVDAASLEMHAGRWLAMAGAIDTIGVTRHDIALDYLGVPLLACVPLALGPARWDVTGTYGRAETIAVGSRRGEQRTLVYDKLLKEHRARRHVPEGVDTWTRVEAQVRRVHRLDSLVAAKNPFSDLEWFDMRAVPEDRRYGALVREAHVLGLRGAAGQLMKPDRDRFLAVLARTGFHDPVAHPRVAYALRWRAEIETWVARIGTLVSRGRA